MMFIVSTSESWAPSFTTKLTGIVAGIKEYGGIPVKLLPVYVNHEGLPVMVIIIGYPSGSIIDGLKLKLEPALTVWSGNGVVPNVGTSLDTITSNDYVVVTAPSFKVTVVV